MNLKLALHYTLLCALITGCDGQSTQRHQVQYAPPYTPAEALPGGDTSISSKPFARLDLPANNLPNQDKPLFYSGKALARQPWIKAPATTDARDGLGPLYNARTCLACHIKGGKGAIPNDHSQPLFTTLVRVSKADDHPSANSLTRKKKGVVPHPVYGDQIQNQSTSLAHQLRHVKNAQSMTHDVPPEAYLYVNWQRSYFTYPDGHRINLRKPHIDVRALGYGPLGDDTLFSVRVAPSINGMGLLALIKQTDIDALADEDDRNQDGISGRVNQVWDVSSQSIQPGRFGLKSNKPTLDMIIAGAFANDIGISNPIFPNQVCSAQQLRCRQQTNGNNQDGFELPQHLLEQVINFNRNLAPLKRNSANKPKVLQGREYFYQSGCQGCHQPRFTTAKSERFAHLSEQTIWPYTDLLLHNLGPDLADQRPEFLASGQEWRTAPLWNQHAQSEANSQSTWLHDGRARTIEEAIIWHGGEALAAKNAFITLTKTQRDILIYFIESL